MNADNTKRSLCPLYYRSLSESPIPPPSFDLRLSTVSRPPPCAFVDIVICAVVAVEVLIGWLIDWSIGWLPRLVGCSVYQSVGWLNVAILLVD